MTLRDELMRRLTALRDEMMAYGHVVNELNERALASVASGDPYDARIALSRENELGKRSESIEEQAVLLLALQQPILAEDLRLLVGSLVVAQRLQRMGHGALGTARLAIDLAALPGNEAPPPELLALGQDARAMLRDAVAAFTNHDNVLAQVVIDRDDGVDSRYRALRDHLLDALSMVGNQGLPDEAYHRRLTFWLWIAHKLERLADHSVVIARRELQVR